MADSQEGKRRGVGGYRSTEKKDEARRRRDTAKNFLNGPITLAFY